MPIFIFSGFGFSGREGKAVRSPDGDRWRSARRSVRYCLSRIELHVCRRIASLVEKACLHLPAHTIGQSDDDPSVSGWSESLLSSTMNLGGGLCLLIFVIVTLGVSCFCPSFSDSIFRSTAGNMVGFILDFNFSVLFPGFNVTLSLWDSEVG